MRQFRMSRRQLFRVSARAGVVVVAAGASGYVGYVWPRGDSGATAAASGQAAADGHVEHFASRPDLQPPRLAVSRPHPHAAAGSQPRYLAMAPKGYPDDGPGQSGLMLVDRRGRLVWFLPSDGADQVPMDFTVQRYQGEPVLTWWRGSVDHGHGAGAGVIYDRSYQKVAEVRAGNGLQADLHEFLLTERGTALVTAYEKVRTSLSAIGGPSDGWVYAGAVQEIDIATGRVLLDWRSLDHVAVDETHQELEDTGTEDKPFDYFHINAVDVAPDGDLLVSARNTWALYKIARSGGDVVWRLGGRKSDFTLGKGAAFHWQHHARLHTNRKLTLFDNGSSPPEEPQSRALQLDVDTAAKHVSLARQYVHPAKLLADNQGSMQLLPGGRVFVCWGNEPYVSEFSRDGALLLDARFPTHDQTYRAFAVDWVGTPTDVPSVVVGPNSGRGVTVYVSWNGATEVTRWRVLAGDSAAALAPVVTVHRSGFETAVVVNAAGPYFAVAALDAGGKELARSTPVHHKA